MGKQTISAAEAWRRGQAKTWEECEERGLEVPLDEEGKIIPSKEALDWVRRTYIVSQEG
jgi:hypothetical protein